MKTQQQKFIQAFLRYKYTIIITGSILFCYIFFIPKSLLGETFFGGVPSLYNTTFSKFFYTQSLIFDRKGGKPEPYTYYQLARIDFINGDLEESLRKLNKELEVYPENTHTYYMLGLVYGYMNREQEGIDAFSKYIEYDKETWAARNDMAWLQFRIGDTVGALNTISDAYQIHEDSPWVLNTYGVMLMNLGKYKEAKEVLTKGSTIANNMTEEMWGHAYPGNDPRIYRTGLSAMQKSFADNLILLDGKISSKQNVDNKKK